MFIQSMVCSLPSLESPQGRREPRTGSRSIFQDAFSLVFLKSKWAGKKLAYKAKLVLWLSIRLSGTHKSSGKVMTGFSLRKMSLR